MNPRPNTAPPREIQPFEPGSTRTLLSATEANQLVAVANAVQRMTGRNGVRVHVSGSNIVVELDRDTRDLVDGAMQSGDPGGSAGFVFRGAWATGQSYAVGDVVIRPGAFANLSTADAAMQQGTFICISAHASTALNPPPSGMLTSTAEWKMFGWAPRAHVWVRDDTDAATLEKGHVHVEAGGITVDAGTSGGGVDLSQATLATVGRELHPVLIDYCDGTTQKKIWVLASDPFTP